MEKKRSRLRMAPALRTSQRMTTQFVKYAAAGLGLIGVVTLAIIIYGNVGIQEDALADSKTTSSYAGSALQFNGTTDVVSIGDYNGQFEDKLSVMTWVKWDIDPAKGNPWANIFTINSESTGDVGIFWLQHNQDNSKFEFALQTEKGRNFIQGTTKVQKGVWYHVTGTYDGINMKIYVNGLLEGTTAQKGTIDKAGKDYKITVGGWANKDSNYRRFTGVIDETSAWSTAMSVTDIRKYMLQKVSSSNKNIIMNFPFDEGKGTAVGESKFKGTITGAEWVDSGAPISPESSYVVKNGSKSYSYTFSNGYTLQVTGMSQDPEAVLFYYLGNEVKNNLSTTYSKYVFDKGIMGVSIISGAVIKYTAKFSVAGSSSPSGNSTLSVITTAASSTSSGFAALRTATDESAWSQQSLSAPSLFQFDPSSQRMELAVGSIVTLPIVLEYFKGSDNGEEGVLLDWATVSEENNDYFTIERSKDGLKFEEVDRMKGAGNSMKRLLYEYTDKHPLNGLNYYRLKQTDYDGKFDYSSVVAITSVQKDKFAIQKVYPNPFVDRMTVEMETATDGTVAIKLANMRGNIVHQESFVPEIGFSTHDITDQSGLEKGIYILTITQEGQQPKVIRVIKN